MQDRTHAFRNGAAALFLSGFLVAGPVALAQEGDFAPEQAQPAEVDSAYLDQFAEAFVAVQEIQSEISEALQTTTDEQEARTMQQEAQDQMVEAVLDTGLSVEEYNQIAQLMNTDPDIREDIMQRIDAVAGS